MHFEQSHTEPDEPHGSPQELDVQVYAILRAIAQRQMSKERTGHTLTATALVNEAYIKLAGVRDLNAGEQSAFYHFAADSMRKILIDHARKRGAIKRGGGEGGIAQRRSLANVEDLAGSASPEDIISFDEAYQRLQEMDHRVAEVVKLRFYAGLTVRATADMLGVSEETVHRDWKFARTQLLVFLNEAGQ